MDYVEKRISSYGASSGKVLDIEDVRMVRYDECNVEILNFEKCNSVFKLRRYFTEDDVLTKAVKEWLLRSDRQRTLLGLSSESDDNPGSRSGISSESEDNAESVGKHVGLSNDSGTFVATDSPNIFLFQNNREDGIVEHINPTVLSLSYGAITAVAISADGCTLMTGDTAGKIVMWKKRSREWTSSKIGIHHTSWYHLNDYPEMVETVAISSNGMYAVSVAKCTSLQWNYDGEAWNSSDLYHDFGIVCGPCLPSLKSCAVSDCGRFVVTGSSFGELWLWSKQQSGWDITVCGVSLKADACDVSLQNEIQVIDISKHKNMVVCGTDKVIALLEKDDDKWTQKMLKAPTYNGCISVDIHKDKQEVVIGSLDGTVRFCDVRVEQVQTTDIEGDEIGVHCVAVSERRIVCGNGTNAIVQVVDLVEGPWGWRVIELDGVPEEIRMDESTRRLSVKVEHPISYGEYIELEELDKAFIEQDGEWKNVTIDDMSSIAWIETLPLEKHKWPLELSDFQSDWDYVYEVPGGEWFLVCLSQAIFRSDSAGQPPLDSSIEVGDRESIIYKTST